MSAITEEAILAALRTIRDGERGDLVALGMISGLQLKDGHVAFAIEVDPARGPALEPLRRAAEKAVDALPGVLSVTAVLTAHRAAAPPARSSRGHSHAPGPGHAPPRPPDGERSTASAPSSPSHRARAALASRPSPSTSRSAWRPTVSRSASSTPTSTAPRCRA